MGIRINYRNTQFPHLADTSSDGDCYKYCQREGCGKVIPEDRADSGNARYCSKTCQRAMRKVYDDARPKRDWSKKRGTATG